MKLFATLILLLNFHCFGSTENKKPKAENYTTLSSLDCKGMKKMIADPKSYGVVMGNKTGIVLAVSEINGILEILYRTDSGKDSIQVVCSNNIDIQPNKEVQSLKFNADGTALGKNKRNEDVFILLGEKSTDSEVIARTRSKGQNFNAVSMSMVTKNKLPGHDAPTWYYHEEPNYIQISFVFPVGFVHPSYGPQSHVRIFVFRKYSGKWTAVEDNSSVGY